MDEVNRLAAGAILAVYSGHRAIGQIPIREIVARVAQDGCSGDEGRREIAIALIDEDAAIRLNQASGPKFAAPPRDKAARIRGVSECAEAEIERAGAHEIELRLPPAIVNRPSYMWCQDAISASGK